MCEMSNYGGGGWGPGTYGLNDDDIMIYLEPWSSEDEEVCCDGGGHLLTS